MEVRASSNTKAHIVYSAVLFFVLHPLAKRIWFGVNMHVSVHVPSYWEAPLWVIALHSLCLCCFWLKRPEVMTVVHLVTWWHFPALYCRLPHCLQALALWANHSWPSKTCSLLIRVLSLAAMSFGSPLRVPRHCVTLQSVGAPTNLQGDKALSLA